MVRRTMDREAENLRGGKGKITFHDIITAAEFNGHGSMYSMVEFEPGSSIGFHQHVDNTEQYFILEGKGIFTDNDGSQTEVVPGDVCYITVGQSHGIANASDTERMLMMALIYNK